MKWKERLRGGLKGGALLFWTGFVFLLAVVITAVVQQWAVPALIDAVEEDPVERTEVRYYQPFSLGMEPNADLKVVRRAKGDCLESSIGDFGNSNAFRCFIGGSPIDPCFSAAGISPRPREKLICVNAPWEKDAVRLTVAKVREIRGPPGTGVTDEEREELRKAAGPWAMELENGQRCIFAQGAGMFVSDLRMNYICFPENAEVGGEWSGVVIGDPDRTEDVWRVQFSETGSVEFTEVVVRTAWW